MLPVVHGPGQGGHGVEAVVCVLALVDPLGADLDLGPDEVAVEELPVLDTQQVANPLSGGWVIHFARLLSTLTNIFGIIWKYFVPELSIHLLLECHLAQVEDGGGQFKGVLLLSQGEAQGVEGLVSELQLLGFDVQY